MTALRPAPAPRDDRLQVAGRLPPHDLEAEAVLLSAVLESGQFDRVADLVAAEDFFADANRAIFTAAADCNAARTTITIVAVAGRLRDQGKLAGVGGSAYLAQLALETPYVHDLESVGRRVRNKARTRRLIAECQRIAAEGYSDVGDVDDWINGCEAQIHQISGGDLKGNGVTTMRDALVRVFQDVQRADDPTGIRTGLADLDAILGPMKPGQLVVIGALSGIGKSALAMNVAVHTAASNVGVLIFSAEMEADELATRALFAEARVDSSKVHNKRRLTELDFRNLAEAAGRVGRHPIWIDDRPAITPAQVRSRTRRLQTQLRGTSDLGLIVVDYLQLLDGKAGLPRGATRENEVASLAWNLKVLAKEARVPVLVLAQLNSDSEKAGKSERKPRLGDLRESKAIGQSADKVILIHNPQAYARAEEYRMGEASRREDLPVESVDLIVAKNRGARTGTVQAAFWPSYTLFTNLDHHSAEEE